MELGFRENRATFSELGFGDVSTFSDRKITPGALTLLLFDAEYLRAVLCRAQDGFNIRLYYTYRQLPTLFSPKLGL